MSVEERNKNTSKTVGVVASFDGCRYQRGEWIGFHPAQAGGKQRIMHFWMHQAEHYASNFFFIHCEIVALITYLT